MGYPINNLLPAIIRYGDGDAQPGQYTNDNLDWTKPEQRLTEIGQRLTRKLTQGLIINPAKGYELAKPLKEKAFLRAIIIKPKKAMEENTKTIYKLNRNNLDLII